MGDDSFGNPKYKQVFDHSEYVSAIVDNKSFTLNSSSYWRYPENQIEVIIQDTPTNRTWFKTSGDFKVSDKW